MIAVQPFGLDIPSVSDIKRAVRDAVADEAVGIAKTTIERLKPEIPRITAQVIDAVKPQIPGLINAAVDAAKRRLAVPPPVIVIGAVAGGLLLSAGIFSFLSWKKSRR